jgi:hypothetical protein
MILRDDTFQQKSLDLSLYQDCYNCGVRRNSNKHAVCMSICFIYFRWYKRRGKQLVEEYHRCNLNMLAANSQPIMTIPKKFYIKRRSKLLSEAPYAYRTKLTARVKPKNIRDQTVRHTRIAYEVKILSSKERPRSRY